MRGRFTDSIGSVEGWSYGAGTEVLLAGDRYTAESIPEEIGRHWLDSGLLEPITASVESATSRAPSLATVPVPSVVPNARQQAGRTQRR